MKRISRLTIAILLLIIVSYGLLGWRCYFLQKYKSQGYTESSIRQQRVIVPNQGQRGVIVDSSGRCLAISNISETVFVDPVSMTDIEAEAQRLDEILGLQVGFTSSKIHSKPGRRFIKIKEGVSLLESSSVKQENLAGVGIEQGWKRYYPMGRLVSHVTGFFGVDREFCEGLEREYYDVLKPIEGESVYIADARRRPIGLASMPIHPQMGDSLVLTMDSTIQQFTYEALEKQIKKFEAESGVAIVMNPQDGAILAMVSLPDYDPADIGGSDKDARRNRALTDPFEPGSIFKPIVGAIALDAGVIDKGTQIFCEHGSYSGKGFGRIGEYGTHAFGNLTLREILINSSNIGMAKIGQKMGKDRLYAGVKMFGFGQKTGIDLPGEDSGILNPLSRWNGYSITRVPYGQEISVTALQVIRAYAMLANGGRPVTPHLVKATVDSNGQKVEPKPLGSMAGYIIRPEIANYIVQNALVDVVKEGTGKNAALKNYQAFGKTGTANIAKADGRGFDKSNYVASFAGGAPAEDPRLVVLVSIRKPLKRLGYTGGTVAAPAVGQILENSLNYLDNRKKYGGL